MSIPSLAAEWSIVPSMSTKAYFNDNLLLTPLPHDPTYGYWISPELEFAGKTERLEVSGKVGLDFVDYYGGERSQFTNIHLPLSAKYKTETDVFSFNGGFTRDNTLMGELRSTGVVLRFTQRNLFTLNPTWTRTISEKLDFQGALQFSNASYQDGIRLGLVDYQVFGGSAGLHYHATEQDDIQVAGTYSNFHTVNAPFSLRASLPGLIMSVSHMFTETVKGTVYAGPRFVNSTSRQAGDSVKTQDAVWVYGATIGEQFEKSTLQFTLAREIFPSGLGLLVETDRVGMTASYEVSEVITASFDASGYFTSPLAGGAGGRTFPDNRYFYLTPQISWQFLKWWKLDVSYGYRWRDVDTFVEPVMANAVTFMLTYYPPKLSSSQ